MYGRYTKDLGEYAKVEARKLKMLERRRKQEDKARNKVNSFGAVQLIQRKTFTKCLIAGIIWQTFESFCATTFVDMAKFIRPTRRGLGLSGSIGNHNGHALLRDGQRNRNVHQW